jgi:hypothetical protein
MTTPRKPTNRDIAFAAGYYIRQGVFEDTPDDRLGRWYIGHRDEDYRPHGAGYPTAAAAWRAAARLARAAADPDT